MNDPLILRDFWVYTGGAHGELFFGGVVIEGAQIVQVFRGQPPRETDIQGGIIHGYGKILMPAHTNCHTHVYSTFARGLSVAPFHPKTFLHILEQLWWKIDQKLNEQDIYYSGLICALDMIRNGVGSFIDHHASPSCIKGSLQILYKSMVEVAGLRGIFSYETSDRYGKDKTREAIEENWEFRDWIQQRNQSKMANGMLGLHASFTLEDSTLKEIANIPMPIHVHVAEGKEDGEFHVERHGMSAVQRLHRYGLIRESSVLAHCIHINQEDGLIIQSQNARIVVNPQSNMNNGVGLPLVNRFWSWDIPVLLGNDGFGTDMTREMRVLLLSQHHSEQSPIGFGLEKLYQVAWEQNSDILSRLLGIPIGKIEAGYGADLITYDYTPPTPMDQSNFGSHFFYGIMETERPRDLIVAGRFLLENGELILPLRDISTEAQKWAKGFWQRIQE